MTFEQLALEPTLLQAITACGYDTPTPIQASAIPIILAGDDMIGIAGTGTGKTAAFMLPALQLLNASRANASGRRTRVLVLSPTRELAEQITNATKELAKFGGRTAVSTIIGGVPYRRQAASLSPAPDVIVATPGRLIDYLQNKQIDLSGIEMLILDEADRMLDMGFIDDVKRIIQAAPAKCQKLMFSATFDNVIANFARTVLNNPKQVSMAKDNAQKASIEQRVYMTHDVQHKTKLLSSLLASENVFKAIIFSATKRGADKLTKQLCEQGYQASELHGDLRQNQRNAVIDKMRKDKLQFLVATDVAARGIDITGITHVFNFDFPTYAEDYVHRIGRTGRAGKTGIAISFVLPKEMRHMKQVERFTGKNLDVIKATGDLAYTPAPRSHSANAEGSGSNYTRRPQSGSGSSFSRNAQPRSEFGASRGSQSRPGASAAPRNGNFRSAAPASRGFNSEAGSRSSRDPGARSEYAPSRNAGGRSEYAGSRSAAGRSDAGSRSASGRSEYAGARSTGARSEYAPSRSAGGRSEYAPSRSSGARSDFAPSRSPGARSEYAPSRNSGARSEFAPSRNSGGRSEYAGSRGANTRSEFAPARTPSASRSKFKKSSGNAGDKSGYFA